MPSTTDRYLQFCAAEKTTPRSLEVAVPGSPDVVAAHWIGEPDADVVVLYFHGGGYTQAGTEGYLRYWTQMVSDVGGGARSLSVLQVAYSLAPEAQYPRQLQESAAVLAHLLAAGRSPARVILAGDSAGGNLVLGLLSHVLHPHEDVKRIELKSEKLGGALLISPWVTFSQEHDSFTRNYGKDMISPKQLRRYAGMFLAASDIPETDPGRTERLAIVHEWRGHQSNGSREIDYARRCPITSMNSSILISCLDRFVCKDRMSFGASSINACSQR